MQMRNVVLGLALAAAVFGASTVHEFSMQSIDGTPVSMSAYKGKAMLLVNVASNCGYTPQYTALEAMHQKYKDRGLVVVGVPANNFGGQEPGTNEEIKSFCTRNYKVTFPLMSKVSVKGEDQDALYRYLTSPEANSTTAGDVKWNFTKFLVGKDGKVLARFDSKVKPDSPELTAAVEQALR